MSDIRFNRWLHQSGTGGVYQASSGNVGIGTSVPSTTLDVNGSISATSITATTGTITGNLSVGGVLTYEDVTNIDSVGVITARNGIDVTGGSVGIGTDNPTKLLELFGTDPTIKLMDSSGDAYALIEGNSADQGSIRFRADPLGAGSGTHIRFDTDGTERLRITSGGNIGVAGATGTDYSLLDGMVINTANGSAGLLINSSSSSHNAYLGFSYGSGSGTSHADQYSAYIGRVGDNKLILGTNNTIRLNIDSSGRVGIQGDPTRALLEVRASGGSNTMLTALWGANEGTTTGSLSDNTDKAVRMGIQHYDTDALPYAFLVGSSTSSANNLTFGGGTGLMNAATEIVFTTASNTTTTTGTERLRITSSGEVLISNSTNRFLSLDRTNASSGSGEFNLNVESNSQATISYDDGSQIVIGTSSSPRSQAGFSEKVRITSEGRLHLGNSGHGTTKVGGQEISGQDYSALLKLYDTRANIWGMQMRRDTGTGPNGIFVRAGNTSSNYSLYVCGTNESNTHLVCRGDGNVGVNTKDPAENLHIVGAVRRDHSTSNIKFYEFSFALADGATTTIATVSSPSTSSMAIAKFEYTGLYGYAGTGFYTGVEMASLRRSNNNSAYTYVQNSEIHADGSSSSYQPNIFWQNGSNNTSDLMITTGTYVMIMGTIRITTYNLDFSRVISV